MRGLPSICPYAVSNGTLAKRIRAGCWIRQLKVSTIFPGYIHWK